MVYKLYLVILYYYVWQAMCLCYSTQYTMFYFYNKVMPSLTRDWAKSRSLESPIDAKTGVQSVFGEILINYAFGTP